MVEEWKDIKNFEGIYQVSSLGKVRSCDHKSKNPKKPTTTIKGKILKPWKSQGGYEAVYLCKRGSKKMQKVHRLVAMAFIPNSENKKEINHIDGNRSNNNASNLEWCTRTENNRHSYEKLGRKPPMEGKRGKDCPNSIRINQYSLSGELIKTWDSSMDIQRCLGIGNSNVIKCCKGIFKTMGGFVWAYADKIN